MDTPATYVLTVIIIDTIIIASIVTQTTILFCSNTLALLTINTSVRGTRMVPRRRHYGAPADMPIAEGETTGGYKEEEGEEDISKQDSI